MRLRQIEVFHAVFSTGSVSRAAELLGVSQPAVSKVLRHTEDALGYKLFERAPGGLVATHEGTELFTSSAKVYSEVERFRAKAKAMGKPQHSTIRVAFAPSIALSLGPEAVAQFLREFPDASIEIETLHMDGAISALHSDRIDIAVVYQPHSQPGIRRLPIAEGEFVCVSPSSKQRQTNARVSLESLVGETVIRLNSDAPLGNMLNAHLAGFLDDKAQSVTANTYYIAKMLVSQGMGIAIVDEISAKAPPRDGVDILLLEDPLKFSVAALIRDGEPLSRTETRLVEHIRIAITGKLEIAL